MSSLEPIVVHLPSVAGRPVLRGADRIRWQRLFCDAYDLALAAGAPPGDATIARSIEATTLRLTYRTANQPPRHFVSFAFAPPGARTLRRWRKALAASDPHRKVSDERPLRPSAATAAPS